MLDAAKIRTATQIIRHAGMPAMALGLSILVGAGINYLIEPTLDQWHSTSHASNSVNQAVNQERGGSLMAVELMAVETVTPLTSQQTSQQTPQRKTTPAPVARVAPAVSAPATIATTPAAPTVTTSLEASVTQAVMPHAATAAASSAPVQVEVQTAQPSLPAGYRIFNGRVIRPAKTMAMVTTAYSPDERSCGPNADGTTASGKSVWTNGMKMAAADTRLLPFGTLISVPGYHDGQPVPVLDRGGAIKGRRLDMLYPTHEIAKTWGRQKQTVTIWEYVD